METTRSNWEEFDDIVDDVLAFKPRKPQSLQERAQEAEKAPPKAKSAGPRVRSKSDSNRP